MSSVAKFLVFVAIVALAVVAFVRWQVAPAIEAAPPPPASGATPDDPAPGALLNLPGLKALDRELTALVERVVPSVVSITASQGSPRSDRLARIHALLGMPVVGVPRPQLGSGVIASENGHIITNLHVVGGAANLEIYLSDGRSFPAKLLGADPQADIAILKIEADGLVPIEPADSDAVRVGQLVFAVGNPLGLQETVTQGIVSGKGRQAVSELNTEFFQTDAAINPGNSGGPLVDSTGRMIAINNSVVVEGQGISFAIPANLAMRVFEDVVERGQISRPWFGAKIWPIEESVAAELDLPVDRGGLVVAVFADSPAERAGILPRDIVLQLNGKPVRSVVDLRNRLAELKPGDTVMAQVVRGDTELQIPVRVEQQPWLRQR